MQDDPDATRVPRRALAALLAVFVLGAPGIRMVARVNNPIFPAWVMYHGNGRDLCTVDFHSENQRSIDRLVALGNPVPVFAPRSQKRLTKERDIRRQGAELCRAVKAKKITVDALCGNRAWTMDRVVPADENLCGKKK